MADIQEQWRKGYLEGWVEQGVLPTSEPSIPPLPSIPSGISDPKPAKPEPNRLRFLS
jgi:hypothetical protein